METFDFGVSGIKSWLTQGMVKFASPSAPTSLKKPQRVTSAISSVGIVRTGSLVVALMMGVNACALAQTLKLSNLSTSAYSHVPEHSDLVKKALFESLESIASLGDSWQGENAPPPSRQAVTAAVQIIDALPHTIADASAGVDGDGNVFFKLRNGEKVAYLTVEPSTMHLLVMVPGQQNVYLDDVKFHPRELPAKIRRTLEQKMVG